jgi:hypothetical protein
MSGTRLDMMLVILLARTQQRKLVMKYHSEIFDLSCGFRAVNGWEQT